MFNLRSNLFPKSIIQAEQYALYIKIISTEQFENIILHISP